MKKLIYGQNLCVLGARSLFKVYITKRADSRSGFAGRSGSSCQRLICDIAMASLRDQPCPPHENQRIELNFRATNPDYCFLMLSAPMQWSQITGIICVVVLPRAGLGCHKAQATPSYYIRLLPASHGRISCPSFHKHLSL